MKAVLKTFVLSILFLAPFVSLSGEMDQARLCITSSWKAVDNAGKCEAGQKIAFLPRSFGNEQLPIMFIAFNCDVRFAVSLTKGGAVCVFYPIRQVVE
ncbi:hypothetical protein [Ectothiorhodospira haloalkaliphila]|uniref:hypothetical protein n=1 Tax=Ectothiorhodospira haloalkaliphila TaxID=421628 RepID=UPI000A0407C7|nr:hypothetical protein [Ectothiorhodospira haloalkaliphila]